MATRNKGRTASKEGPPSTTKKAVVKGGHGKRRSISTNHVRFCIFILQSSIYLLSFVIFTLLIFSNFILFIKNSQSIHQVQSEVKEDKDALLQRLADPRHKYMIDRVSDFLELEPGFVQESFLHSQMVKYLF